jgi:hypothetical protein
VLKTYTPQAHRIREKEIEKEREPKKQAKKREIHKTISSTHYRTSPSQQNQSESV